MAEYGCARMTVSKAIAALAQSGLVERRRKAGTFVARPRVETAVLEIPDIGGLIQARGESYRFELLARKIRQPSADPGEDGLLVEGEVLWLEGVHMADSRPFALERRIIALQQVPDAITADFDTVAPGAWLLAHVAWTYARHRIGATSVDALDARKLEIAKGAACLQVERWTWRLKDGVTFVRQLFPGDGYSLMGDFAPP